MEYRHTMTGEYVDKKGRIFSNYADLYTANRKPPPKTINCKKCGKEIVNFTFKYEIGKDGKKRASMDGGSGAAVHCKYCDTWQDDRIVSQNRTVSQSRPKKRNGCRCVPSGRCHPQTSFLLGCPHKHEYVRNPRTGNLEWICGPDLYPN